MGQYEHRTIRESNGLAGRVGAAIAQLQDATSGVDEAAAAVLGLNLTDLRCLGQLYAEGPATPGDLAARRGLSRGAITTALDRLERAAYVRRIRSATDRRQILVQVTPLALDRMEMIWGPIARAGLTRLAELSPDQLCFLLDFLQEGRDLQEREAARIRAMPRPASAPGAMAARPGRPRRESAVRTRPRR